MASKIPSRRSLYTESEALGADGKTVTPSNFVAQLSAPDLATLVTLGASQHYARGEPIFSAGAAGRNVYFLRSGKVKIKQMSPIGREVILWFCLPGEIFGLAEVARGGGRIVTAQACETSEVLAVSQEKFRRYVMERPQVAMLSMQVLAARLRLLGEMLVNFVGDDANTRIAKLILRLSSRYGTHAGKDVLLTIPLTHQEIADMVGTTRQTVTSALSSFKRQGVLSIDNRRIRIESEELLNDLTHST